MTDYINREEAKKAACAMCVSGGKLFCSANKDFCSSMRRFDVIPAADVREVKRGHWIGLDEFPHEDWECDVCGSQAFGNDRIPQEFHFCPNCGADMREKTDAE